MALQIHKSFDENEKQWNIVPRGEVDIATSTIFRSALDEAYKEKPANIILHFDQIRYMDSTGLGVIIGTYDKMRESGYRIILRNPQKNIKKLLSITNLDRIFCAEFCEK